MHDNDWIAGAAFWTVVVSIIAAYYVAEKCGHEGFFMPLLHGLFLGPFGLVLIALYPRLGNDDGTQAVDRKVTNNLLADIHAELKWQRKQREKEIHRAKAAASGK